MKGKKEKREDEYIEGEMDLRARSLTLQSLYRAEQMGYLRQPSIIRGKGGGNSLSSAFGTFSWLIWPTNRPISKGARIEGRREDSAFTKEKAHPSPW